MSTQKSIESIVEAGKQRADWFEPSAEVVLASTIKEQMTTLFSSERDRAEEDKREAVADAIERCAVEVWNVWSEYKDRMEPTDRTTALSTAITRIRALTNPQDNQ